MDPDSHQLHVRHAKGGKERIVPLSGNLYDQIHLFAAERRAGPIFENVTVRTLQRWYDEAIRVAGIEKKGGPHTARHTFATILRANGFTLDEIQLILGHSSRVTTEIYAKLTFTPETRDKYLALYAST